MTEQERQALFHKIRSMLRRAESSEFEAEAMACLDRAQAMMLEYAVSEEELWASEPDKRKHPTFITFDIPKGPGSGAKRIVLNACAKSNNCMAWYKGNVMTVAGYESDLLFVDMLYTSIAAQMSLALAFGLAKTTEPPRSFRASFQEGYSERIYWRLLDTRKETIESDAGKSTSTALVLASREQQVERYVSDELQIRLQHRTHRSNITSDEGYDSGSEAGDKADISGGRGRLSGRQKRGELNA